MVCRSTVLQLQDLPLRRRRWCLRGMIVDAMLSNLAIANRSARILALTCLRFVSL
jgi:hypothetical protein